MRGKAVVVVRHLGRAGITPAHAGKSRQVGRYVGHAWDHPRPCGEKYIRWRLPAALTGSPPPMRGKAAPGFALPERYGITPAHAGKRGLTTFWVPSPGDHPRPCGEKPSIIKTAIGKTRITPAHAGKRLRKRRNTGIFFFQISRFHSVSHTPDTSYGNRPALYVRRLPRTPAALQASKAYDRARWAAYAWLFAVCPHTGS